ncbi:HIT-like protein [Dendrothele bispora CBS 962.96]|uniref:HIT-like protein n=1 Tax=Dendrothele bispora (strain CBS 962.96) TaxID=1314807 RepID=A0A4S8MQ86_DENBC|nr:HIT-like protein [Dendrothele bispora CBS 962.96]
MTSFIIKSHVDRPISSWSKDKSCPFCRIIEKKAPSYTVYENDMVVAFLDIMPLRRGHTLVIPKTHCSRISDLTPEYAAAVGQAVSKIANALTKALGNTGLNIVCNQEYAQAVLHVHYHIIPAPVFDGSGSVEAPSAKSQVSTREEPPKTIRQMHQMEFESRNDLDEEEAVLLVNEIKARL